MAYGISKHLVSNDARVLASFLLGLATIIAIILILGCGWGSFWWIPIIPLVGWGLVLLIMSF